MPLHFIVAGAEASAETVVLTGAEAHHAAAVRRVRVGEQITIGDGTGLWLTGQCTAVAPREVVVQITDRATLPAPTPRIVLVQALAKGDRDELAVQAAAELGADEIVPWQAARSVSRWDGAKAAKGRVRWQSIVREAAKQAHRAWVPDVAEVTGTAALVARAATSRVVVLDPVGQIPLSALALHAADSRDVVLVVGPEGGVAPEERAALVDAGAAVATLGPNVLRTSTAGPAALVAVGIQLGRI
ncbi:16S rRNA (uracil(1498)-N(3))-methyltransferase [Microbacterium kribbense]|uniref:Ribosomal RNA small subunit methyltransferase E n=1 Tax=Microbacterium kribbense TaxID=433645 RepID=A0ABP7GMI6_9MICO